MMAKNMELDMAILEEPHFKRMHAMLLKDMHVKTCDELKMKLMKLMMEIKEKMGKCPLA
jgi:hypothetical protein